MNAETIGSYLGENSDPNTIQISTGHRGIFQLYYVCFSDTLEC